MFGSAIEGDESDDESNTSGSTNGSIAEEPKTVTGLWGGAAVVKGGLWGGAEGWERKRRWTASTRSEFSN